MHIYFFFVTEQADKMRSHEIKEVWKPSFMSNDEFQHLMLEAVNAFLILFDKNGKIIHVSESVIPLLGHSTVSFFILLKVNALINNPGVMHFSKSISINSSP